MMQMEGWQDLLHTSFLGEHVLFGNLKLDSFGSFLVAGVLSFVLCLAERAITFAISSRWYPAEYRSRLKRALWRTAMYWIVTFLRLLYMLIAMTFHVGLLVVVVSSLALGQFFIEYTEMPYPKNSDYRTRNRHGDYEQTDVPLLSPADSDHYHPTRNQSVVALESAVSVRPSHQHQHPPHQAQPNGHHHQSIPPPSPNPNLNSNPRSTSPSNTYSNPPPTNANANTNPYLYFTTRQEKQPRGKPNALFIHPNDSNLARADAQAMELGLSGETEYVADISGGTLCNSSTTTSYASTGTKVGTNIKEKEKEKEEGGVGWQLGKGKQMARALLGATTQRYSQPPPSSRQTQQQQQQYRRLPQLAGMFQIGNADGDGDEDEEEDLSSDSDMDQ